MAAAHLRRSPTRTATGQEAVGHPGAPPTAAYWVNQTVAQRRRVIDDPHALRGSRAPKRLDPTGIGRMITTKINANIGASPVASGTAAEVEKLQWAQQFGADTLMDLSTGGNLTECRQAIIDHATIPIGTVPIYSMIIGRRIEDLTYDLILKEIERQAQQGVDYFTIHAGRAARAPAPDPPSHDRHRVARRLVAREVDAPSRQSRTRCTSSSTRSAPSCASTTSPTRSATACDRAASPTPPIRRSSPS